MTDREITDRLISLISEYTRDLKEVAASYKRISDFKSDKKTQRYVERTLQIDIEACLDLANHIISSKGFREPTSNADTFSVLSENRAVPPPFLNRLKDMASFRNLMVHNYAKVDVAKVYGILRKHLKDFDAYLGYIVVFLKQEKTIKNKKGKST
ncbi:MAG: DUF86 domain-containing protein [Nitrospirae bacterium]|nr:DUF86 domain-containing protein [Nitrospirota bacterium]